MLQSALAFEQIIKVSEITMLYDIVGWVLSFQSTSSHCASLIILSPMISFVLSE